MGAADAMGETTARVNDGDDITLAVTVFDEHRRRIFGIA